MIDIQNSKSNIKIPINSVGVNNFIFPINLVDKEDKIQQTIADISMSINLPKTQRGIHMSRFIEIFEDDTNKIFNLKNIPLVLKEMIKKFECKRANIVISAPYFIKKISPVSKKVSLLKVDIKFMFTLRDNDDKQKIIELKVPVTSLCPCSKEISKYGAHNQRSFVNLQIICKDFIWIEDLVDIIEKNASSPIYPLLKRVDEKYVTEKAYENPVFVEDLVRKISQDLINHKEISWFKITAENQESVHTHNVFATYEWGDKYNI